ncbi:DgyrCDS9589 [Dimorphilus gyrociliatus]|uniref:DgyrCDS9589 n=1 Tax=Dimorphilus gyrociliatus TaxID=2664684 RepID=A0A7I8VZM2_9ANNE|nr:DgyrCDS9589 [Dimorphilus gyrociliatus]
MNNSDNCNVHSVNTSLACQYIKYTQSCISNDGYIDYTQFIYCDFNGSARFLGLVLVILWWLVLFISLAVVADDFFCPSLVIISKTLKLSDNIAGVTLLAFGNGAPDVFSSISAVKSSHNGDISLALCALTGAGVFVTTVVAGSVAFAKPFSCMQRPFLRDTIFFIAAACMTLGLIWNGRVTLIWSCCYLGLYIFYVIVVIAARAIRKKWQSTQKDPLSIQSDPLVTADDEVTFSQITFNDTFVRQSEAEGRSENNDDVPLLSVKDPEQKGFLILLINGLKTIDYEEFKEKPIYKKIYDVVKSPALFAFKLTTPVVEEDSWNKPLSCLQCVIGTTFIIFAANYEVALTYLGGRFPVFVIFTTIGILLAVLVHFTSTLSEPPVYYKGFSYLAFIVAILWINTIANEVVNALSAIGIYIHISPGILGLTLLAWGNSLGDMIADIAMAKQGFPRTAISACFGGPLFTQSNKTAESYGWEFDSFNHSIFYNGSIDEIQIRENIRTNFVWILCNFGLFALTSSASEAELHKRFKNIQPAIRPLNEGLTSVLEIDLVSPKVMDLVEHKNLLRVNSWLRLKWKDDRLKWSKEDFADVNTTRLQVQNIWTPRIILSNMADTESLVASSASEKYLVRVTSDGDVTWTYPAIFNVDCHFEFWRFPYDTQHCWLHFTVVDYLSNELKFTIPKGMRQTHKIESREWIIMEFKPFVINPDQGGENYPDRKFKTESVPNLCRKLFLGKLRTLFCVRKFQYLPVDSSGVNSMSRTMINADDLFDNEALPRSPTLSLEKTLEDIRKYLRVCAQLQNNPQASNNNENATSHKELVDNEWNQLTTVLERLFFCFYIVFNVILSIALLSH